MIRRNENYCEGRNKNNNCTEPPWDAAPPPSCPDEVKCSGATGVCNPDTRQCVQCTADQHAACTGATPVCGPDATCQKCTAHVQCTASSVCLPNGECAEASSVAYVREGGSGTTCSKDSPCGSIDAGLGAAKQYIKITGTITENLTLSGSKAAVWLADPGAKLKGHPGGGRLIDLRDGYNLTIRDLELFGATGTDPHAIFMSAGAPTLSLHHVLIHDNAGGGIVTSGGTLNIERSTIANNQGGGIIMNSATTFDIRNNFIVLNGNLVTALTGAVRAVPGGNSKFEFNTVVGNRASNTATTSAGLVCTSVIAAPYNIVFDNTRGGPLDEQIVGCDRDKSLRIEPPAGAGFKDPNVYDYHLTANTAAQIRDAVDCPQGTTPDIDGEGRPKNGKCDLGADEY